MKKTLSLIFTLALTLAIAMGTTTTIFAIFLDEGTHFEGDWLIFDETHVTMDTVLPYSEGKKTVGDLFWTGEIGSAESSGSLDYFSDSVTWTLGDGVLILKGDTSAYRPRVRNDIKYNSPFWNNEHIETIIIDGNIDLFEERGTLFGFGLPNLKTVIFLGDTKFDLKGQIHPSAPIIGGYHRNAYSDFPTDHTINFVWEACKDSQEYTRQRFYKQYGYYPSVVGTSVDTSDFYENNAFFTDRAYYAA